MENQKSLTEAVKSVTEALKNDPEYFIAWQANIAMQFQDEYAREQEKGHINKQDVHRISNNAAIKFLNLLIGQ